MNIEIGSKENKDKLNIYIKKRIIAANDFLYKYEKYIDAEKYEQILYGSMEEKIKFIKYFFKTMLIMEKNAIGLRRFIIKDWWKIKIDSIKYNLKILMGNLRFKISE